MKYQSKGYLRWAENPFSSYLNKAHAIYMYSSFHLLISIFLGFLHRAEISYILLDWGSGMGTELTLVLIIMLYFPGLYNL